MRAGKSQKGLSLVELMIALALSAFLVGGLIYVFTGSKQAYRTSDALNNVQESGRFALELIARDLREAGFTSGRNLCGGDSSLRPEVVECPDASCDLGPLPRGFLRIALDCVTDGGLDPDRGGEDGICGDILAYSRFSQAVGDVLQGSTDNSLELRTPWRAPALEIVGHAASTPPAGSSVLQVNEDDVVCPGTAIQPCIEVGTILIALDDACDTGALFTATGVTTSDPISISHARVAGGNRTQGLGRSFADGLLLVVPPDATPSAPTVTYAIATNDGRPALVRGNVLVVDGVEDMEVRYRLDGGTAFVNSAAIANWADVVAVRVRVLAVSREDNVVPEAQPRSIFYPGDADVFDDRRLRQVFTTTVALRNPLRRAQP